MKKQTANRREFLRCICTVVGLWLIVMAAGMTAHVAQSGTDALGWRILIPATVGTAYLTIELPYLVVLLPRKKARKKPLPVLAHKQGAVERDTPNKKHNYYSRKQTR